MHFDHERIPERVVHARGVGVHGVFEAYGNAARHHVRRLPSGRTRHAGLHSILDGRRDRAAQPTRCETFVASR